MHLKKSQSAKNEFITAHNSVSLRGLAGVVVLHLDDLGETSR
jgi:hypothetical protein